jgi:hypothetical protein
MLLPNRSTKLAEKEKSYGGFAIFFGPGTLRRTWGTRPRDGLVGKPTLFWLGEQFHRFQQGTGNGVSALCSNRGSGFLTVGFSLDEDGSHAHSLAGLDV